MTPEQTRLLAELAQLNRTVEAIDTEAADRRAEVNTRRARLVSALRDSGIGIAAQAEQTGVHYTTLYRLLPSKPRGRASARS